MARNLRNRVNIAMRAAKAEYIKDQLEYNQENPKKFWNLINKEILPGEKENIFNFKKGENGKLYEQDELPDLINNYFADIGPTLAQKIPNTADGINIKGAANQEVLELRDFTLDELLKLIKKISIYKSSGIPTLSTRFFRDTMLFIPHIFLHIYNRIKSTGLFPNSWKLATVIPLPKCNKPKDASELRPVSLLPIVGKVLEKLIHVQMSMFLENTMFLSPNQHGFRKEHSTSSASSRFIDDIALGLDKGKFTLAVFLDIKKAFDTIDHVILIQKLRHAGCGERLISLLTDYLMDRKQSVLYNGMRSSVRKLETGVPQGSTLGPLLFLLYVNDLSTIFDNTKCMMFADDTVLYQSHLNVHDLYYEVQDSLDRMNSWCAENQITLNRKKCEYVHFNYRKIMNLDYSLKLGEVTLDKVGQYKYLGTIIDEKLNGEAQYNNVIRILSARKLTFSKIRFLIDLKTAERLFKTTIQPIFDYNDFFYNMLNNEKQEKLQTMQNRFLRLVYNNVNMSTNDMHVAMGTGKLANRRELHLCGLMYRRSNDFEYIDKRDLHTRQFDKVVLKVPDVQLTKSFNVPIFKGANLWNRLPRHVQLSPTYKEFKYRYKNHRQVHPQ